MQSLRSTILKTVVEVSKKQPHLQKLTSRKCSTGPLTVLTDDEIAMRDTVRKLATEKIAPYIKQMESENKFADEVVQMCFENGLMGMEISADYGGSECSFLTTILAIEELSKVDASVAVLVDIHNTLVARFLDKVANEQQKKKYLPKMATNMVGSYCLSEPTSGSDAFSLRTTATKAGDHYVLNGGKMWISNSDLAEVFVVMANVDPSKGYKGISCFIVDRNTPGFEVGKKEDKLGIRASGTCALHFDNCKIPEENVLGEIGEGYKYAIKYLNEGRIGIAAQMLGIAEGAFDATLPYLLERTQFKKKLFDFQAVQHQISRLAVEIEAAKLMTYNAARLVEAGKPFNKEAAMAKLHAAEVAGRVTSGCIDLMGGVGFTKDFPHEKFFRDSKIGTIYEGTSNMMLHTIARYLKQEFESS